MAEQAGAWTFLKDNLGQLRPLTEGKQETH